MQIVKYYTYTDLTGEEITFCNSKAQILSLIRYYNRFEWITRFSQMAINMRAANSWPELLILQEQIFGIRRHEKISLLHNQALNAAFQFVFSVKEPEYYGNQDIKNDDFILLFALINTTLDFLEAAVKPQQSVERMFYSAVKAVSFARDFFDQKSEYLFYTLLYVQIFENKNKQYKRIVEKLLGVKYEVFLDALKNRSTQLLFEIGRKLTSVPYDDLDTFWKHRENPVEPPGDFGFTKMYPVIIRGDQTYLTNFNDFQSRLVRLIYLHLCTELGNKFKADFGKKIVEPVFVKLLSEYLLGSGAVHINLQQGETFEYGDLGLLSGNTLFIFEIKSSILKGEILYRDSAERLGEVINRQFVNPNGVFQQVKSLKNIGTNMEKFRRISGLKLNRNYQVIMVLVLLDDSFSALFSNRYFSGKFDELIDDFRKECSFAIGRQMILTVPDIYALEEIPALLRSEVLIQYSESCPDVSLREYIDYNIQQGNIIPAH